MVNKSDQRTLRVVVADDNEEIRLVLVKILGREFMVIDTAASGRS